MVVTKDEHTLIQSQTKVTLISIQLTLITSESMVLSISVISLKLFV